MPSGYWQSLTTEDFAGLDPETAIALLPVGAVEQHGPHLPLATDALIAEELARLVIDLLPETATVLVLPGQSLGDSGEHGAFPGTLDLTPETLIRSWSEIGRAVRRAGLRKMVILNSHGGQPQVVDIVAQRLRRQEGMLVVKANTFRLGLPDGLFDQDELKFGIHAGAIETSVMLHLHPELVRRDKLADFPSLSLEMEGDYDLLGPGRAASFAWAAQDLNPAGACGDARQADAEKGRAVVDHWARSLARILEETARFPLSRLRGPS